MSRVKKLRIGAALVGVTAMAFLSSVAPASATPVKGELTGVDDKAYKVDVGGKQNYDTSLFGFKVGDKEIKTYCVDIETKIDPKGPGYVEADWNSHPKEGSAFKENSAKINWVLHNGYPTRTQKQLADKITGEFKDGLSVAEAITGTQAAIWHFSDKMDLNVGNPTPDNPDAKDDVVKVYKYLIDETNVGDGIGTEPKPVLTLEPAKLTGKADSLIGPFVVTTSAKDVTIAAKLPEGVIFSDKNGQELPKAEVATKIQQLDKYEFYVKVPAAVATGKVDFTVAGDTEFSLGRLFISQDASKPSQSLIVATSQTIKLDAKGVAEWGVPTTTPTTNTPAPQAKNNELANTGASILTPILIGVVLVGAGVGALIFQRRRRA